MPSATEEWYAVRVRQPAEKRCATLLEHKGYEIFLPSYPVKRRWSDRYKVFQEVLFPGYLFCRLDSTARLPVLMTSGVISILGAGKEPIPVPEAEVEAVRRIVNSPVSPEPWPFLACGQNVLIKTGPLRGLEGLLAAITSTCRVVVSISLLQRSVAVEVDRDSVEPISVAPSTCSRPPADRASWASA